MSKTIELGGAVPAVWVKIEKDEHGYWNATSPNLFGLHLWSKNRSAVLRDIPVAIRELLKLNHGIDAEVKPLHSFIPDRIVQDMPNGYALEPESLRESAVA